MQLNVYVPQEKEAIIQRLDQVAKATRRSKNEMVLEAIESYLRLAERPEFRAFHLGEIAGSQRRSELYEERLRP